MSPITSGIRVRIIFILVFLLKVADCYPQNEDSLRTYFQKSRLPSWTVYELSNYDSLLNNFTEEEILRYVLPIRNDQQIADLNFTDPDTIKQIILYRQVNFIFKHSTFPVYNIPIPINWIDFNDKNNQFTNNSWQFQFRSLSWLHWYTDQKIKKDPNKSLDLNLKHQIGGYIISDYTKNALSKSFAYGFGDHPTARRLDRTREFLQSYISHSDTLDISILKYAVQLSLCHYFALMMNKYYKDYPHNHGLMMDIALMKAINFFNFPFESLAEEIYLRRMKWQVENSVSNKGVHLEHSPGYQSYYINLLNSTIKEFINSGVEVPDYLIQTQEKMILALTHLSQPNLTYPQFGVTDNKSIKGTYNLLQEFKSLNISKVDFSTVEYVLSQGKKGSPPEKLDEVYEDAGFASFRFRWSDSLSFSNDITAHYACNFHSWTHYHRSEGNFEIYGYGTEIIVDAGHYNFDKKNPYTYYSYQAPAHNVLLVNNTNYRPHAKYFGDSKIVDMFKNGELSYVKSVHPHFKKIGINQVFRYFGKKQKKYFFLIDSLYSKDTTNSYQQLFHFAPQFDQIDTLNRHFVIVSSSKTNQPKLILYFAHEVKQFDIVNGDSKNIQGWYFPEANKKVPIHVLKIHYSTNKNRVILPVIMEVVPPDANAKKFIKKKKKYDQIFNEIFSEIKDGHDLAPY